MTESFSSSQESDILPPEFKTVLTAEYAEIINTVQVEDPYTADVQVEEVNSIDIEQLHALEFSDVENSILLLAPLPSTPSPTCVMPATEEYVGPYNFEIQIDGRSSGKNWVFSYDLYKLFINMNSAIHLGFKCDGAPPGLYIRALPVYCGTEAFQEPVVRCLHHRCQNDVHNQGILDAVLDHVMRIDSPKAIYDFDESSKRRSVRVALDAPQAGSEWVTIAFKFMCKNSCTSGMARRPIEVIFTLENENGVVFGRHKMKVRICSCPKRDKLKEEEDLKWKNGNTVPNGKRALSPAAAQVGTRPAKQKFGEFLRQIPVLGLEEFLDVTDYAQSRLLRKLRIEKREPTENEQALLQKYKHELSLHE
ncbi:cellular tumor antigen p53-like [Periplaneta americana]|uniref:cellular tumor antigen p53-like n=1 Tax=Periplaneta americana TaxID=6978 RepID=UPI0037E87C29